MTDITKQKDRQSRSETGRLLDRKRDRQRQKAGNEKQRKTELI